MDLEAKCRQFFGPIIHVLGYVELVASGIVLIAGIIVAANLRNGLMFAYFFSGFVGGVIGGFYAIGFGDMMANYDYRGVAAKAKPIRVHKEVKPSAEFPHEAPSASPAVTPAPSTAAAKAPVEERVLSPEEEEAEEIIHNYEARGYGRGIDLIERLEQDCRLNCITEGDLAKVKKYLGFDEKSPQANDKK